MNVQEMLLLRLEYCKMKAHRKKGRSPFYNYKVKQYTELLHQLKLIEKESLTFKCDGYKRRIEMAQDTLYSCEMTVEYLDDLIPESYQHWEYVVEHSPKDSAEYATAFEKKRETDLNIQGLKDQTEQRKAEARMILSMTKWLSNLAKFYEASLYDLTTAMEWDKFCEYGKL